MMLNPHTSVAIAQVVFYLPIFPIAIFILVRNWKYGHRRAWYPLATFSLLRFVGGILTIVHESSPGNVGLMIATIVLLNVGMIPLLISVFGIVGLILKSSIDKNQRAQRILKMIRITFLLSVVMLVTSGSLSAPPPLLETSRALAKASYALFAVILALLTIELIHLYTQKHRIASTRFIYVQLTLASLPTLAVRVAYGLLCEFTVENPTTIWNPLFGSVVAFALMCLFAEYITLLICLYLGIRYMGDKMSLPSSESVEL
ncbi:hypothetical protein BGZ63DRAFT_490882 [Mariannaea sp. PMI_226]|nr:hypothetical protein BGZ63DRAFT_490882 [Mariannaea sp. PMI_226]